MKLYLPLILLLLASCSPKEQKNETVSENTDTITVNVDETTKTISTEGKTKTVLEPSEIKSMIDNDFKNKDKLIQENKFGGGDCFGTYKQNNIKEKNTTTTAYTMDCGDYGFTNYRLLLSENNTPLFLEKLQYENDMSGEPQVLEEWLIDFQDTTKAFYRKYERVDYETTTIPNDVNFQVYEGNALNISDGLSEIESGKTAKLDEY